ncbi:hypothetical protein KKA02_02415 [Patescibacteria group bacterium]|nr:hypothetical protein [Patescibacteria group bacterium]
MNDLLNHFSPNQLLALESGILVSVLIILVLLSAAINWFLKLIGKEISSTKFYLAIKLVGTLSIITLAFAADNFLVYLFSIIIIATLITELDFIEKVAAMISKSSDYFRFRETIEQGKTKPQENLTISTEEQQKLNEELKKDRDGFFLLYHFERTYRLIFGSQLSLLNIISKMNKKEINNLLAQSWYNRTSWHGKYPFINYMNFLNTSQLTTYNSNTNTYSITKFGEAFLNYLNKYQIPQNKPF